MNLVKEVRKSIFPLLLHLMRNEQRMRLPSSWLHLIWKQECVWGGGGVFCVPLKGSGVSGGVVWRSSVWFVDNWDLEVKHRESRWCVGCRCLRCVFVECVSKHYVTPCVSASVSLSKPGSGPRSVVPEGTSALCGEAPGCGLTSCPSAMVTTDVSEAGLRSADGETIQRQISGCRRDRCLTSSLVR